MPVQKQRLSEHHKHSYGRDKVRLSLFSYHFFFNSLNPSSSFLHVLLLSRDDDDITVMFLPRQLDLGVRFLTEFAQGGPAFPNHVGVEFLEHADFFTIVGGSLKCQGWHQKKLCHIKYDAQQQVHVSRNR